MSYSIQNNNSQIYPNTSYEQNNLLQTNSSLRSNLMPCNNHNGPSDVNNNYLMNLMKKDKSILSLQKSLTETKTQLNSVQAALNVKNKEIISLRAQVKDLTSKLENAESQYKFEQTKQQEQKNYMDLQMNTTNQNIKSYMEKYNDIVSRLKDTEDKLNTALNMQETQMKKIKENEQIIISKDQHIQSLEAIIINLKHENTQLNQIYVSNTQNELKVKEYLSDLSRLEQTVNDYKIENCNLNKKIQNISNEQIKKEQTFNTKLFSITNELNELNQTLSLSKEENNYLKNSISKNEYETEQFTLYITTSASDLISFIDTITTCPNEKLYSFAVGNEQHIKNIMIQNEMNEMHIKYELLKDAFNTMKKRIYDLVVKFKENEYHFGMENEGKYKECQDLITINTKLQRDIKEAFHVNENLNRQLNEQLNKFDLCNDNYLKLKDLYAKLYSDFELAANKNENFVNDTRAFLYKLLTQLTSVNCKENDINITEISDLQLNSKLLKQVANIIEEVKDLKEKLTKIGIERGEIENIWKDKEKKWIEEIELKNKEIDNIKEEHQCVIKKLKEETLTKVKDISKIVDESKRIIEQYEQTNKTLINENQTLKYRYNMLLSTTQATGSNEDGEIDENYLIGTTEEN